MRHVCEITVTLDIDFRLMLCSNENLSCKNIASAHIMLVDISELYLLKSSRKFRLETPFKLIYKTSNYRNFFSLFLEENSKQFSVCFALSWF